MTNFNDFKLEQVTFEAKNVSLQLIKAFSFTKDGRF